MYTIPQPAVIITCPPWRMSRIKGKNTKPEMPVKRFLHAHGYRYRLHDKKLPGKPDILLPKYGTVIFVHGCFWHGHKNCKYFVVSKTRTEWWLNKINGNMANDVKAAKALKKDARKIISLWEGPLKQANIKRTFTPSRFFFQSMQPGLTANVFYLTSNSIVNSIFKLTSYHTTYSFQYFSKTGFGHYNKNKFANKKFTQPGKPYRRAGFAGSSI